MFIKSILLQSFGSIYFLAIFLGCESKTIELNPIEWSLVDSVDIESINQDLEEGRATIDVGIYFPSNFDPDFKKVTLENIISGFLSAKEIYSPTSVQLKLIWIKTGKVDNRFLSLQANEIPQIPQTEYTNMYTHMKRHPSILTKQSLDAFSSIIEPNPDNHRTIYLIALQEVFFPFLELSEGRNWMIKTVRTGGLSFPSYSYCNTIPKKLRGVITLTNLSRPDRLRRTIAHEIGHKAINVSHEYGEINPQHEIYDEGGLMVYGSGEEIGSGKKGRWHRERLMISPFIYRYDKNGNKTWNNDYEEGGHYYDPIYGGYAILFKGSLDIDEDW